MNKRAGFLINTIILVVVLVAGIIVGLRFSGDSDELVKLQEDNLQLKERLQSLQSQVEEIQNETRDIKNKQQAECVANFKDRYEGALVAPRTLIAIFVSAVSNEQINAFASDYGLTVEYSSETSSTFVIYSIPEGEDIYEQACILKQDERLESVEFQFGAAPA